MLGVEPAQHAGPVQEIVHERIDGDHAAACFAPDLAATRRDQQDTLEDAAGRITSIQDNLGNSANYTRDLLGGATTWNIKDPSSSVLLRRVRPSMSLVGC